MYRARLRNSFVVSVLCGCLFAGPVLVRAESTELSVQKKSAESAPNAESEEMMVPGSMPEFPEESETRRADELNPPPEVPLSTGPKLGVGDCVQMALLNNREVRSKDYEIEIAENKLKEAQPRGIPVFNYEFFSAPAPRDASNAVESFFTGNVTFAQRGKIEMGIPVYSFGKIGIAQELAKNGIAAEKEKKVDKQNDVILKVKQLYYGLLLAKDVHDLFEDAAKHLESEVKRRESGNETNDPVEMVRLKLFRYEVLNRLLDADKKAAVAREGLRIQMGLERGTQFSLQDEHLKPVDADFKEFDRYLEMSRRNNPKTRLLDLGLRSSEAAYRLEKRKWTPDVGVGGFYEFGRTAQSIVGLSLTDDYNDPFNFNRVGFGLRIKGEINIRQRLSKIKEAEAEYLKTALGKNIADEGLELDLRDAYLSAIQSRQTMENGYNAMKLARQYVFLTKTNIDIGVGDKKDYSDALQAYLVSRGRYLESVFNYNIAVANLELKAGGVAKKE